MLLTAIVEREDGGPEWERDASATILCNESQSVEFTKRARKEEEGIPPGE